MGVEIEFFFVVLGPGLGANAVWQIGQDRTMN